MARLHGYIRYKTCPFDRIEPFVPQDRIICDLGCGHGLFSIYLALLSDRRKVIGYDLSEEKINIARNAGRNIPNVEFHQGNILTKELQVCDAIMLLDVLYLISYEKQEEIIERCCEHLRPGGLLVVKTTDKRPRWKYLWAYSQEMLAVKLLGITMGHRLYFRHRKEFSRILNKAGFGVRIERIDKGYIYPHIMFICKKPVEENLNG